MDRAHRLVAVHLAAAPALPVAPARLAVAALPVALARLAAVAPVLPAAALFLRPVVAQVLAPQAA